MDFASRMAEEKIQEAIRKGDLDNLPGRGKRLHLEDLSAIPEDMRTSYLLMKNSGYLPEEVRLKKELLSLQQMIDLSEDPDQKAEYQNKLSQKEIQLKLMLEKQNVQKTNSFHKYSSKIYNRFGIRR
ncbi:DnaJ family domain-containing protein [Sediminibacillus albus]|uniref:DnaJ homologue subfamily C member 28 conserved domain-containing protein n=1 Tax=Sediminibacillus albus TaxID=407036 RepID=A0A1G9B8X3_9BACI|nr:DnaJ family domain-containing protein [Sediminibacillus albus]SDK35315.1 protein of unknown function [Sediminibacillus albus]